MPYKDKDQQLEAQRRHYRRNKGDYLDSQERIRDRNAQYVWGYLQGKSCAVCGESDPIVLEFDHRNPGQKECSIADAVRERKFSLSRLQTEIDKCDILCANCHRRKTASEIGYRRFKIKGA